MTQQVSTFADSCDETRIAGLQEACRQYVLESLYTPHGNDQNLDLQGRHLDYPAISFRLAEGLELSQQHLVGGAMIAQVSLLRNVRKD